MAQHRAEGGGGVCGAVDARCAADVKDDGRRSVPGVPFALRPVTLVAGHYGAGKTTVALNLALDAARAGIEVTLVDLDVVNPYFRSSEYRDVVEGRGVALISPVFGEAGSSLDAPSLTGALVPAVERAYEGRGVVIVDVGGDDVGSTALGRFASAVSAGNYDMLYVANRFRNLTQDPLDALEILRDVEKASRLRVTGVVGNGHLKADTDVETAVSGARFACEVAAAAQLPLRCSTVPQLLPQADLDDVAAQVGNVSLYAVFPYVTTPWER